MTHRHGTERVTAIRSVARRGPYAPKPVSRVVCAQEGPKNVDAGAPPSWDEDVADTFLPNILPECLVFLCIKVAITTNIMQICTKMYDLKKIKISIFSRGNTPGLPCLEGRCTYSQHRGHAPLRPGHRSSARSPNVEHKSVPMTMDSGMPPIEL